MLLNINQCNSYDVYCLIELIYRLLGILEYNMNLVVVKSRVFRITVIYVNQLYIL